ncbi:unnamed protein product [Linum tenue]|uniref:Uncharacterized protein n=1 Tax=Linum tenue TaxID=586396 RepID=A0AAV0S375_9ROSI|nr:unnamed protein product [Linum tenue]
MCRATLPLRLLFQRIRKKDKVAGTPIRLFLSLKLREWSKGPLLLDWKEKQSKLIRLLNIQLRTCCHQRMEVRMEMSDKNKGNREKSELAATGGSAPLAKYRHEEDGIIQAEAEKVVKVAASVVRRIEPKKRGTNDEKMKKLEDEIVDGRNAVPHIVESVLQRLGVRLPESFDIDLNNEANGEQGRVGETQGKDVADDESDEETAEETADA